jgi:hypothetical protein
VLLVEIDEAKLIGQELVLADAVDVSRRLPIYILGTFRNDGQADKRRVTVELKLQRGEQQVGRVHLASAKPDEMPAKLLEELAKAFAEAAQLPASMPEPATEIRLLNERAVALFDRGSWESAEATLRASLLLDPQQPEVHRQIFYCVNERLDSLHTHSWRLDEAFAGALAEYHHALTHLEHYLRNGDIQRPVTNSGIDQSLWSFKFFASLYLRVNSGSYRDQAVQAAVNTLLDDTFAVCRAALHAKAEARIQDDTLASYGWVLVSFDWHRPVPDEVRQALFDDRLDLLRRFTYLEGDLHRLMNRMMHFQPQIIVREDPIRQRFLEQLSELDNREMARHGQRGLQEFLARTQRAKNARVSTGPARDDMWDFSLKPLQLIAPDGRPLVAYMRRLMPCAPGMDLLLTDSGAFYIVDGQLHELGLHIQLADVDRGGTGRTWIVTYHRETRRNGIGYFHADSRHCAVLGQVDQVPEKVDTIQSLDSGRALASGMSRLRWWGLIQVHADGRAEFQMLMDQERLNAFLEASGQELDRWYAQSGRLLILPDGSQAIVAKGPQRQIVLMDSRSGALTLLKTEVEHFPQAYEHDFEDEPLYYDDQGSAGLGTVMRMSIDPIRFTPIAKFGPRRNFAVYGGGIYYYDLTHQVTPKTSPQYVESLRHSPAINGPFKRLRGPLTRDTPLRGGGVEVVSSENFGLIFTAPRGMMSVEFHDPPIPAQHEN